MVTGGGGVRRGVGAVGRKRRRQGRAGECDEGKEREGGGASGGVVGATVVWVAGGVAIGGDNEIQGICKFWKDSRRGRPWGSSKCMGTDLREGEEVKTSWPREKQRRKGGEEEEREKGGRHLGAGFRGARYAGEYGGGGGWFSATEQQEKGWARAKQRRKGGEEEEREKGGRRLGAGFRGARYAGEYGGGGGWFSATEQQEKGW
ncbi:uncharacterized protein [Spinacia oleracea]|uniref:Uncharacterized protein n=1 Tax=Spinacia oleracea TaxID=3562 RepID=A0ABM3QQ79_SPIOL|nr:uncharacterized protein LOC130461441 [Spinacia oleracea]